jgi:hypothetical protein
VVHAGEYFNMGRGINGAKVPGMQFSHKGFFGSVPKMDIGPVKRF